MRRQASMMVWRFSRSFAADIHFPYIRRSETSAWLTDTTPAPVNQMLMPLATGL
jgi:hypothetical protein